MVELTDYTSTLVPAEKPRSFFFSFRGDGRVPYNVGNTERCFIVAQEHFKVGCLS